VGVDVHLQKDLLESQFRTFQETYKYSKLVGTDQLTVAFEPKGKVVLQMDKESNSFRSRANFVITYGRSTFNMDNVNFEFRPIF